MRIVRVRMLTIKLNCSQHNRERTTLSRTYCGCGGANDYIVVYEKWLNWKWKWKAINNERGRLGFGSNLSAGVWEWITNTITKAARAEKSFSVSSSWLLYLVISICFEVLLHRNPSNYQIFSHRANHKSTIDYNSHMQCP